MEILRKSNPPVRLFGRRGFLTGTGATLLYAALAPYGTSRVASAQKIGDYPFTLGVASGDPTATGVVLWTRLAPKPFEGGGMPGHPIAVQWQIATDERMERIVKRGAVLAVPELGHSVHVEVEGLEPSRWYWYRFRVGNEASPVGRTKTAPAVGSVEALKFAFVSCQHYANGLYHAHKHLAEENLDFAVHLGDYIYEGPATSAVGRPHLPDHEITSIDDYRIRYALYKSDPHLQAVHARFPWIMTWDDHETENDYAGFIPENAADPADNQPDFAARRARAYQAYYEHMPLRAEQVPSGPYLQLYRELSLGALLQVQVLDTRQYRSHRAPAACALAERVNGYCPTALDPSRTIEGAAQQSWLIDAVSTSTARWNLFANQVPFAPNDTNADPLIRTFGGEKWDGYPADRQKVLDAIAARGLGNTVVITGDVHANFVRNVPPDHIRLDAEPIATEFIGTSISTGGDRTLSTVFGGNANNPHLRLSDNHHGYVRCTVTPELWRSDYRVVPSVVQSDDGGVSTLASFVVEQGKAGAQQNLTGAFNRWLSRATGSAAEFPATDRDKSGSGDECHTASPYRRAARGLPLLEWRWAMVAIDRILCPVDLSPCSQTALRYASALARWYDASVTVLHVFRQAPVVDTAAAGLGGALYAPPLALADVDREALSRRVTEFVAQTPDAGTAALQICEGVNVREEILREAAALPADLLVLGSHGLTGMKRLVLGSTAENVLRHATMPTLVVPAHAPDVPAAGVPFKRILCAVGFEADSYRALRYAFDLAQESDAQLTLLHAVEMPAVHVGAEDLTYDFETARETVLGDARARLEALVPEAARAYCTVHVEVAEGRAHEVILQLATEVDADLIIMGVRDRDAFDVAVFGSHAQAVVRAAHCPVLTVHQD